MSTESKKTLTTITYTDTEKKIPRIIERVLNEKGQTTSFTMLVDEGVHPLTLGQLAELWNQ